MGKECVLNMNEYRTHNCGELRKEDKSQIRFYMDYIDKNIKQQFHNNTIGIIISKSHNKYIATFVSEEDIIPLTYELKKESEQICE